MSRILLFFCFIAFHTIYAQHKDFSLLGKTAEIEDGTYLYMRDLVNGGAIDSAQVKNNNFRFDTELKEPALYVMLFTMDRSKFKELWLENKPMAFDASSGDFKDAKVTGSVNHSLFKKLKEEVWADYQEEDKTIIKQREKDFIKNNPDALMSAFILFSNNLWDQNEIGEAFSNLSEEVRSSSFAQKKIVAYLEKDLPALGENFIDISIPNSEGKKKKISELTGKATLLQFWSPTCSPSRNMNTILAEVYQKYHSEGFEIISISKDTNKEDWLNAIKEDNLSWPQLSNLQGWKGEAFQSYGVSATPTNFLINKGGIIVAKNLRSEDLETEVKNLLEE